jgi:hypothetical protein
VVGDPQASSEATAATEPPAETPETPAEPSAEGSADAVATAPSADPVTPSAVDPRVERPGLARRTIASLREAGAWMRDHYLRMDPRTAGLFRIVVGFLTAGDCLRHAYYARDFYSNEGVLSNHWHLFKPDGAFNLSLFHAFSSPGEVYVAFALAFFCHVCLMIGWHSRLFAVLTFVIVTSMDNRIVMVENGGYVVVNLVTLYACFLPIERRFSIDALRRSWRERRERTAKDLETRYLPAWATEDYVSLAVFLVALNLAVVYLFNVVNKSGETWRKGETVHYVLYLNRMVTGIAVFFRKILPIWSTRLLTWGTITWEALLVPWILWPSGKRVTRTLAILGVWVLHTAFGTMFRLGPFAWFMIAWSFSLASPEQWALLDALHRRRARPRTVLYDPTSPVAFVLCRLLSRLDGADLLRFEESDATDTAPPLLAARDDTSGERSSGTAALRSIAQALPAGRYLLVPLLPILAPLFALASARREGVARFFGLDAPLADAPSAVHAPSPLRLALGRSRVRLREAALAYFMLCAVWQTIIENKSIPEAIRTRLPMPAMIQATIGYPRLYQGWGMFAPNPITDDGVITVDARTIDGRQIDPFTGAPPVLDITRVDGLGLGQIPQDYFNRIRMDRNATFRQGLGDWLRAYHLRTGRAEDEVVSYDVYWVRDQCPNLQQTQPTENETIAILTWRKPGYHPAAGLPPLPPEPKIASAETPQPDKSQDVRRIFGFKLPSFMQ